MSTITTIMNMTDLIRSPKHICNDQYNEPIRLLQEWAEVDRFDHATKGCGIFLVVARV